MFLYYNASMLTEYIAVRKRKCISLMLGSVIEGNIETCLVKRGFLRQSYLIHFGPDRERKCTAKVQQGPSTEQKCPESHFVSRLGKLNKVMQRAIKKLHNIDTTCQKVILSHRVHLLSDMKHVFK